MKHIKDRGFLNIILLLTYGGTISMMQYQLAHTFRHIFHAIQHFLGQVTKEKKTKPEGIV